MEDFQREMGTPVMVGAKAMKRPSAAMKRPACRKEAGLR